MTQRHELWNGRPALVRRRIRNESPVVVRACGELVGWECSPAIPNSIGRPCVNPGGQAVLGSQVSSPALECPSRFACSQPAGASSGQTGQTATAAPSAPPAPPTATRRRLHARDQQYCKDTAFARARRASQSRPLLLQEGLHLQGRPRRAASTWIATAAPMCRSRAIRRRTRDRPARTSRVVALPERVLECSTVAAGQWRRRRSGTARRPTALHVT